MFTVAAVVVVTWLIIIAVLLAPTKLYSNLWDHATQAEWRADRDSLRLILAHLQSRPEEWSMDRENASWPAKGAKQIYITKDDKRGWEYTMNSFGSRPRPLEGHFGARIVAEIVHENSRRESQALIRNFYPEINSQMLLRSS